MEENNMEDSFNESLEDTFTCRNKCGKISNLYCQDCKLEFCKECSKSIHQFKAFANHRIEDNDRMQHLSITNLTQTNGKKGDEKKDDVWINPGDFKLFQVLSLVGAESKVKINIFIFSILNIKFIINIF